MAAFVASTHQQRFFDWIATGHGSAVLVAVPGAGKTTTIFEALRIIPEAQSVHVLSFNSINTVEARERLKRLEAEHATGNTAGRPVRGFRSVRCTTFHGLGFGAVCKRLGKKPSEIETDGKKLHKLFAAGHGTDDVELYGAFVCKLVSLAKGEGVGALVGGGPELWQGIIAHHDLMLESEDADEDTAIEMARALLRASNEQAKLGIIDFDDQIYLPLLWRLRLWQNDWVFVDEAQDTSPTRRAIAKLALRPGGRLVAVGDPFQAINGFAGASNDALDIIIREFNCTELTMPVSYRCPKVIEPLVRTIVPYFEVALGAEQGVMEHLSPKDALERLGSRDVVLCRQTAPLVELAYAVIRTGRGCVILGRDVGAGLVNLIKQMRAKGIPSLEEKLVEYRDREHAKFMARGEEGKADSVCDRVACIETVIRHLPETERTVPKLMSRLADMFSDNGGDVLTLSTVHKAKGREWKRVAIYQPELMPSRFARQDWQHQQELNLMNVAYTRTQGELYFIDGKIKEDAK
jgi:superfamily I DNA/RNA helicase